MKDIYIYIKARPEDVSEPSLVRSKQSTRGLPETVSGVSGTLRRVREVELLELPPDGPASAPR